jgi:hypothetical protein
VQLYHIAAIVLAVTATKVLYHTVFRHFLGKTTIGRLEACLDRFRVAELSSGHGIAYQFKQGNKKPAVGMSGATQ